MNSRESENVAESPSHPQFDVVGENDIAKLFLTLDKLSPPERKEVRAFIKQDRDRLHRHIEAERERRHHKEDRNFWAFISAAGFCFVVCFLVSFMSGDPENKRWAQSLTMSIVSGVGSYILGKTHAVNPPS